MLHYETIDSTTLELLNKLQRIKEFSKLRLVGGTSLALQLGHRKSIDLDLFGILGTDEHELRGILKTIGSISILEKSKNINIVLIDNIKVDLVNYSYPPPPIPEAQNKERVQTLCLWLSSLGGWGDVATFLLQTFSSPGATIAPIKTPPQALREQCQAL